MPRLSTPYRPVGLLARAVVAGAGVALADWAAVGVRDVAYLAGLGLVALALLSLVSAERTRPPVVIRVVAVLAAVVVLAAGVWVPRAGAQASARTDVTIPLDPVAVSTASRSGLTELSGGDLYLTDADRVQRLDVRSGRAAQSFPLRRGRVWVTADETLVRVDGGEVEALSTSGESLWRRDFEVDSPAGPEPVAAAEGVVVVQACERVETEGRAPECRRTGIGPDGDDVFVDGGFDLPATMPAPDGGLRDDGVLPTLPSVYVSRPRAASDDVEIRSAEDAALLETVRRAADTTRPSPVVTGRTVVVSSGGDDEGCRLAGYRDGVRRWTAPDGGCTPTSRSSGGQDARPTLTGDRLWLPRYDDRTLTLDLRTGDRRLTPTGRRAEPGRDLGRRPDLTAWTPDVEVRLDGRRLTGIDAATGDERWRRTLPRRALRWWVRGDVVAVRTATDGHLLLDPARTDEQVVVLDARTGRIRDVLRLAADEDDDRDSVFVPFDTGLLRLAPVDPDDVRGPWRADVVAGADGR